MGNKQTLLPCPFCGGEGEVDEGNNGLFYARCSDDEIECQAQVGLNCGYDGWHGAFSSHNDATRAWNTRHNPTPPGWQDTPPAETPCLIYDGAEQFVAWSPGGKVWMTTGAVQVYPVLFKTLDKMPEV